ncbi:MAG TPA: hypothetical protein PLU87_07405 [Sedimentisphaerales bacterium]|nr:hypothetical protein [Sedimentisphaerales bacterium]HRS10705.1 hypothetical protein [Sedimentisphaerales bacterium]HRV47410.1 hypothetical protein [Sedimentisphaerales bacterium]
MSVLTMNLKQLYQRRGLWLAYLMFAFYVWVSVKVALDDPRGGKGTFIGLIVLAFMVGMTAAVLQTEILTKPMAFCLPQHRRTVVRFIVTIGIATNALGAMLFLFYPGLPLVWRLLVLGSAFAAGLVLYLAGAWWGFFARQPMALIGFLVVIFFFGRRLGLHVRLEQIVVLHPVAVMAAGVLAALAMWLYLTRADLARRNCLRPWIGFAEVFDRDKLRRSPQYRSAAPWTRLKDHPRPWVESFFIDRIAGSQPLSTMRCAWGAVYNSFALVLSQWRNVLFLVVVMTAFLGYLGGHLMVILLASLPIVVGAMGLSHGALYSSLLTAGGRRERFTATLAVAATGAVLVTVFMALVAALSVALSRLLPELHIYGRTLTFGVISTRVFYGPWVLLPVAAMIHLLFYRRPLLSMILLIALMYAVVLAAELLSHDLRPLVNAPAAATLAALCWLIFILVLSRIAHRRPLVR